MFQQITLNFSDGYSRIRRYDNHGRLGFTGNHCGNGRLWRSVGETSRERAMKLLRSTGWHLMDRNGEEFRFGKFVA